MPGDPERIDGVEQVPTLLPARLLDELETAVEVPVHLDRTGSGVREWWTATRFTAEATTSKIESTKEARIATDPVSIKAINLMAINAKATQTEA